MTNNESTVTQVPFELQRSIPRPVELTQAGVAAWIGVDVLVAITIATCLVLAIQAGRDARRSEDREHESAQVRGVVERMGRTRGDSPKPIIVYGYTVAGVDHQGRSTLRRSEAARYPVGASLEVRYLPSDPRVSWIAGHEPRGVPSWLPIIVALGMAPWSPLIAKALRRQRRLLEEGRPAIARVTSSRQRHGTHGHTHQHVEYEFTTLSGARRTGRFDAQRNVPVPGSTILVLYDPDEPKRQAPYPIRLYRVERVPA